MSKNNDDSFQNMNLKEKTATVIGITFFIVLMSGFVLGIYFFGFAGAFELLGVQYQSIWSLVIFVVSFFILGFLVDLPFDAMAKLSIEKLTGKAASFFVQMLFGFVSNWIVLVTVDVFVGSIALSLETKLIVSLVPAAEALVREAAAVLSETERMHDEAARIGKLMDFDRRLKAQSLNPGTSADLTVATLFVQGLRSNLHN